MNERIANGFFLGDSPEHVSMNTQSQRTKITKIHTSSQRDEDTVLITEPNHLMWPPFPFLFLFQAQFHQVNPTTITIQTSLSWETQGTLSLLTNLPEDTATLMKTVSTHLLLWWFVLLLSSLASLTLLWRILGLIIFSFVDSFRLTIWSHTGLSC